MTTLRLGSRAAAERFAAALEAPAQSTDLAAPLAELTLLARRLATVPGPTFDPAASARIRQRLVAVATVQATDAAQEPVRERSRPASARVRRLASVAVGSLAGVTAVAGVAVGASHSLPGDPFYGLKRAAERVQLDLAGSPADKGRRELEFASTRLAELRAVGVDDPHAAALLHDLRSEVAAANADLTTAARTEHSRAPLTVFETTTDRQLQSLLNLAKSAPASLLPQIEGTVTQITHLRQLVRTLGIPGPSLPGAGGGNPAPSSGGTAHPSRSSSPGPHPHRSSSANPGTNPNSQPSGGTGHRQPSGGSTAQPGRSTGPKPPLSLPTELPTTLPTKLPTKAPTKLSVLPSPVTSLLHSVLPSRLSNRLGAAHHK